VPDLQCGQESIQNHRVIRPVVSFPPDFFLLVSGP
jgi:hypothetical protein